MKRFFFVICISLFSLSLFAQKAYVASHGETEMLLLIYPESNKWILFTEYNKSAKRFSGKLTKDEDVKEDGSLSLLFHHYGLMRLRPLRRLREDVHGVTENWFFTNFENTFSV